MSCYAAILLPQFSLQAALRLREEMRAQPIAISEGSAEKGWILEMTAAAADRGVLRGMASAQALARCPALRVWTRSPAQEQVISALLLEMAGALSAYIEATSDGLCLVDLRRTKPCDWQAWALGVVERLASWQLQACVGVASNPDLAALAATRAQPALVVQHPGAFLAGVAIAEVDAAPDLVEALRGWGIGHLGDLAQLSRHDVVARLGPEAGFLWERAAGRTRRELRLVRPPEVFAEAFDFEQPIDTTEPLLFILRRQLDQLTRRLREAHRVVAQMTLTLPLDGGVPYERVFTVPSPTGDVEVLFRILHTHLESLRLEQQPKGVRLLISPVIADSQQFQIFESPLRDPNRFGETLGRLAAIVGAENVGVVQMEDTHRPDSFRLAVPEFSKLSERRENGLETHRRLGLPLSRFRPALPAQLKAERGVPAGWMFSPEGEGEIVDAAGPYRLSGSWWDRDVWKTEEWDVELSDGSLYRLSKQNGAWFLEGCYQTATHFPG